MTDRPYTTMPLDAIELLANESADSYQYLDGSLVIDDRYGIEFASKEDALFHAAARDLVLELVRRLRDCEKEMDIWQDVYSDDAAE